MTRERNNDPAQTYLLRKLRPFVFLMSGLFLFSGILLPLCLAFGIVAAAYAITILVSLGILFSSILIVIRVKRFNLRKTEFEKTTTRKIKRFTKGNLEEEEQADVIE